MLSRRPAVDASTAASYIGKTVLMELVWEQDPEPLWCIYHVVGIVLPVEGVYPHGYFLILSPTGDMSFPQETFFSNIRTIRVMRHRDRQSSGNVLGRIARPNLSVSGAALPARRDGFIVPSNGSTGAAHP
jgi:hypothetical protein